MGSKPFSDARHGIQRIPGRVLCACYDLGGEGVAYHDADPQNHGSGALNPADGSYLGGFRMGEGVDISYTKPWDAIDDNPFNLVQPPMGLLYVGWTEPGEWLNYTTFVTQPGRYRADLLYTAREDGAIAIDVDGVPATGPLRIPSTYDPKDPIPWRQWHHWSLASGLFTLTLGGGWHTLTLHTVAAGQMNYAYLDFTALS